MRFYSDWPARTGLPDGEYSWGDRENVHHALAVDRHFLDQLCVGIGCNMGVKAAKQPLRLMLCPECLGLVAVYAHPRRFHQAIYSSGSMPSSEVPEIRLKVGS